MSEHTPSRLPAAFVRVSKCPLCRYSLKDLADDAPCPECGSQIDRELLSSPELRHTVNSAKDWSLSGILSWGVITLLLMLFVLPIQMSNWARRNFELEEYALVAIVLLIPSLSTIASFRWHFASARIIYRGCIRRNRAPRIPIRIISASLIGMLLVCVILTAYVFNVHFV